MTAHDTSLLEQVLKRDRQVMIAGLSAVIVISWIWLLAGAGMSMDMFEMTQMSKPAGFGADAATSTMSLISVKIMKPAIWNPSYAVLMFSMWWVMMVAMMTPSAATMVLLFARINRKEKSRGRPFVPSGVFALGYVTVWGVFSVGATFLQWALERSDLMSSMMVSSSVVFGGILLIAAGVWQFTPLKQACLRHCHSPIGFLSTRWRAGRIGAFTMGLEHGAFCLGCCWFLMGLLFYGGVMNLYWIAGLAAFVLIEKLTPDGQWFGKIAGAGLIFWGAALLTALSN